MEDEWKMGKIIGFIKDGKGEEIKKVVFDPEIDFWIDEEEDPKNAE